MYQVFVYGTLKPHEAAYEKYCEPFVIATRPACMQGDLFHLPQGYPAMTTGDRWISGALLIFSEDEAIARIDQFEDYDPIRPAAANLYQRCDRSVFSPARQPLGLAWVYLMSPEHVTTFGGVRVDNGDWSKQRFAAMSGT
ncbi:MAG: gamma-glutamylcyclotransferase [Cyanobacteria bacterium P01_F01_bin.56]